MYRVEPAVVTLKGRVLVPLSSIATLNLVQLQQPPQIVHYQDNLVATVCDSETESNNLDTFSTVNGLAGIAWHLPFTEVHECNLTDAIDIMSSALAFGYDEAMGYLKPHVVFGPWDLVVETAAFGNTKIFGSGRQAVLDWLGDGVDHGSCADLPPNDYPNRPKLYDTACYFLWLVTEEEWLPIPLFMQSWYPELSTHGIAAGRLQCSYSRLLGLDRLVSDCMNIVNDQTGSARYYQCTE